MQDHVLSFYRTVSVDTYSVKYVPTRIDISLCYYSNTKCQYLIGVYATLRQRLFNSGVLSEYFSNDPKALPNNSFFSFFVIVFIPLHRSLKS